MLLKCKDPEAFTGSSAISILQKDILNRSSTAEEQNNLLQGVRPVESSSLSIQNTLNASVLCKLLISQGQSEGLMTVLNNSQLLKTNLFENISLTKKETLLGYCNDYYQADSSILMRDFIDRNLLIVTLEKSIIILT